MSVRTPNAVSRRGQAWATVLMDCWSRASLFLVYPVWSSAKRMTRNRSMSMGNDPMPIRAAADGSAYPYSMVIGASALAPPHVTVIVPVPGVVSALILQLQETRPLPEAVFGPRPCSAPSCPSGVV